MDYHPTTLLLHDAEPRKTQVMSWAGGDWTPEAGSEELPMKDAPFPRVFSRIPGPLSTQICARGMEMESAVQQVFLMTLASSTAHGKDIDTCTQ